MLRHKTVYRFQRSSSLWSGGENRGKLREEPVYASLCLRNFAACTHFLLKTIWTSQPPSCLPPQGASIPVISETFWTELITPSALLLFPTSFLQSPSLFPFGWLSPAPHTPSACNGKFSPRFLPPFSSTFQLFRGALKEKTGSPSLTAALSFHSLQQQTLCFSPSAPPHFGYWVNHMQPHPEHVLLLVVFKIQFLGKEKKIEKNPKKPARWRDMVSSCMWNEGGSEKQQPTPSFQSLLSSEGAPPIPPGWPSTRDGFLGLRCTLVSRFVLPFYAAWRLLRPLPLATFPVSAAASPHASAPVPFPVSLAACGTGTCGARIPFSRRTRPDAARASRASPPRGTERGRRRGRGGGRRAGRGAPAGSDSSDIAPLPPWRFPAGWRDWASHWTRLGAGREHKEREQVPATGPVLQRRCRSGLRNAGN